MNKGLIRLISTSQCMYNCFFCHKEGIDCDRQELINSDDIAFIYYVYNKYLKKNEIRISRWRTLNKKGYG